MFMYQKYFITKEQLEDLYVNKKYGTKIVSDILKTPRASVRHWLKKYNIPLRHSKTRYMDLLNHKFNQLTVIEPTEMRKHHQRVWKCKCDCGNICYALAYEIKGGYKKSCGCFHKLTGKKNHNWRGYGDIGANVFTRIKRAAEIRDIPFEITIQDIWNLFLKQNRKCALSGIELKFANNHRDETTASLDRIDSSKDYTIDNVQWVHKDINAMKQDLSEIEFIDYCQKIINYNKLKKS